MKKTILTLATALTALLPTSAQQSITERFAQRLTLPPYYICQRTTQQMTIDGQLDEEQILELECEANEVIYSNLAVEVSYPGEEELEKIEYRSKIEIEGQTRLVTIPGVDICACCAPHVKQTGEIGDGVKHLLDEIGELKQKTRTAARTRSATA